MPDAAPQPELSIIAPALNEQENVAPLAAEIEAKVRAAGVDAELIVVDDGSTDETWGRLTALAATRPWLRPVRHAARLGQSAAMFTGIRAARGAYLATLDADLQNDPADLPRMLERLKRDKVDMVQGMRVNRKDHGWRKFSSWVGRTFRKLLLGDSIRDTGCSTRVLRTDLAKLYPLQFRGMHRFLPVYARILGASVVEEPVNHRPRVSGSTKYGLFNRAIPGFFDCLAVRWMRKRVCNVAAFVPTRVEKEGV